MQISQWLNPINMPQTRAAYPYQVASQTTTPEPTPPAGNGFNTPVDGSLTRFIYGGIMGKNMGHLILTPPPGGSSGLDGLLKNPYVRQTGISMGVGAGLYAGLSVLKQGIGMATGKQDARGAAANIITDAVRGGVVGLGASAGGGLTGLAMRAMGATGTIGTIFTFVGGAIGASIGGGVMESTGLRDKLVSAFGSQKAA